MTSAPMWVDARHRESGAGWPRPWLIAGVPGAGPGPPAVTASRPLVVPPLQYPNDPPPWLQASPLTGAAAQAVASPPAWVDARHRETITSPVWLGGPPGQPPSLPPSRGSTAISFQMPADDGITVVGAGIIDSRQPIIKALVVDRVEAAPPPPFMFAGAEGIPGASVAVPPVGNIVVPPLVEDKTNIQAWVAGPPAGAILPVPRKLPWGTVVVGAVPDIEAAPYVYMYDGGPYFAELFPSRGNAALASSFDDQIDKVVPGFTWQGSQWIQPFVFPTLPPLCNPFWSADGFYGWTADGFPGWSADGYEPTPLACAQSYLAALGINIGTITYVYSQTTPLGWVITGYPGQATFLQPGAYMNLVVSNGPAPPTVLATVPNVVGLYYYDAQLAILDASLRIAPPIFVLSSTVLPGYVISQSLVAGSQVNAQQQMTITVAGFQVVNQPNKIVAVP